MQSEDEKRDIMARKFISAAANNSHSAIKNVWLILFTAGTFAALTRLDTALKTLGVLDDPNPLVKNAASHPIISIGLFIIYFLTFFRFYVGDTRIFDVRYSETLNLFNENISLHKHSLETEKKYLAFLNYQDQDKFKFEAIFLIFQTLLIVYLSYQILTPISFIKIYVALMITNSIWLTTSNLSFNKKIADYVAEIFPKMHDSNSFEAMFPQKPGWLWVINNVTTAIILGILLILFYTEPACFNSTTVLITATMTMLGNCLYDILKARDFYFPQFSEFYMQQSMHLKTNVNPLKESKKQTESKQISVKT